MLSMFFCIHLFDHVFYEIDCLWEEALMPTGIIGPGDLNGYR